MDVAIVDKQTAVPTGLTSYVYENHRVKMDMDDINHFHDLYSVDVPVGYRVSYCAVESMIAPSLINEVF
jgi:hypothetical protein